MLFDYLHIHASRVGLSFGDRELTFGELAARSAAVASFFDARGLRQGDRLAVYLANSIELIDLYLACLRLGVIFVPVNILYREGEISHICGDAAPAAIVAVSHPPGAEAASWIPLEEITAAAAGTRTIAIADLPGAAPAAIVYTSGTTGRAKGVILTREGLLRNAANLIEAWGIHYGDRLFLPLPLFHVHGLGNGLHCWIVSGCRLRLVERFEHAGAVAELLDERPTILFAVPAVYVRLLQTSADHAAAIGRDLRLAVSGSAPLAVETLERFGALFGHTILERYGMTETLMTLSNPLVGERRPGAVGLPLPGVEIRIVLGDGREAEPEEIGQLFVRSPTLFAGYWRSEEATSRSFRDGWFLTGDLASRAADGYVTLHGRMSDLIISGGFNIDPREIEEVMEMHERVCECAVLGVPHEVRGEVPVAFYTADCDLSTEELEAWCRDRLASFKAPRRFIRIEALPRTALGKIQRSALRGELRTEELKN